MTRHLFLLRLVRGAGCALVLALSGLAAQACPHPRHVRLAQVVEVSAAERAAIAALAPLRVLSGHAPPLSGWDAKSNIYSGVSIDVWCALASELGLRYEFVPESGQSLSAKVQQVQQGQADVFLPLSFSPERAQLGLFSRAHYQGYYSVIARKGWTAPMTGLADLAPYRVGSLQGVALQEQLKQTVPAAQLHLVEPTNGMLFELLRSGELDLVVFNQDIFEQVRYQREYFDLEVVYTLRQFPRAYGFYFAPKPQYQLLLDVMDRYLEGVDVAASVRAHENGLHQLLERYAAQREQRLNWQMLGIAAVLVLLLLTWMLLYYRRMHRLLSNSHAQMQSQKEDLLQANAELARLSMTDSLTGLANRRQFDDVFERELARQLRTGAPLALLLLDIDHFKAVNDFYGHAMGDNYLRAVAQVLRKSLVRASDLVARFGGEEFVCLLPDTDSEGAQLLAERMRQAVMALALPNAHAGSRQLTVSIGVVSIAQGQVLPGQLLQAADMQLYAAKNAGRNQVRATVLRAAQAG